IPRGSRSAQGSQPRQRPEFLPDTLPLSAAAPQTRADPGGSMNSVRESQYLSGGFYLARRKRGPHTCAQQVPETTISASSCISDFFPNSWAIRWSSDDRHQRELSAGAFGITPGKIDGVV